MCAKRASTHKSIVYHTNAALNAWALGDRDVGLKHLTYLEENAEERPLHEAYKCVVRGHLADDRNAATFWFHAAVEHFSSARNVQGRGAMLLSLARLAADEDMSLRYARDAREIFRKSDDRIGFAKALLNIGASHIHLQDYKAACEELTEALSLHGEDNDILGAGIVMLNLSACYDMKGDLTNAHCYAVRCLEALRRAECMTVTKGCAMTHQWRTNGWANLPKRCEQYVAQAYINLGNSLRHLGEFDQAVSAYLEAEQSMRVLDNVPAKAAVYNQIGEALRQKKDYAQALTYFERCRVAFEAVGVRGYEYAVVLQGLGQVYAAEDKLHAAARCYRDALREFKSCGHHNGQAEMLLLIGELHHARKKHEMACQFFRKGRSIGEKVSAADIVVRANRGIGSAMMHVDSAVARECLKKALLQATEYGMKVEQMQIHRELSSCYKLANDPWAALSHLEQFVALRDEIFTEQADRQLRNNEILHNVEQYRDRVRTLELANEDMRAKLVANERMFAELFARIMEKQAFVSRVEDELGRLVKSGPAEKAALAAELLKLIRTFGDTEQDRARLAEKFLLVHQNLLAKLLALAPDMTATELQVCVLTRLTMTAKDIAPILDISAKVVSNHHDSIRRKVKLAPRENLKTFLLKLDVGAEDGDSRSAL